MRFIRHSSRRVVAIYAAAGLVIGFIFLPLIPLVRVVGFSRDSSVGVAVFGLMPLFIVVIGLAYPRLSINLLGLVLAILTWALGYAVANLLMGFGFSSIGFSLVIMAPFLVPGYVVLALVVFVLANLRRTTRRGA